MRRAIPILALALLCAAATQWGGPSQQRIITADAGSQLLSTDGLVSYQGRGDTSWVLPNVVTVKGQRVTIVNQTTAQSIVVTPPWHNSSGSTGPSP